MTIKQLGGVFGRNPTFNDVTIDGELILNGEIFTGLDFQGSWNASTNTPTLASGVGTTGEFYIVSVAGTTNLDGITNWGVGDWAMFSGSAWQRVEGNADGNFVNLSVSNQATFAAGIDVTGDITLGDTNPSITFNDSSVTNLSHTILSASDNFRITADANGVDAGSRVEIFDGSTEVARFSAGALDVTGSVTADGLTASASTADYIASITNSNGTDAGGGLFVSTRWNTNANSVAKFVSNSGSNVVANFAGNGDVSFYEDTGTTAKFVWDASAESLGIGTDTPSSYWANADDLVVATSGNTGISVVSGTTSLGYLIFADSTAGGDNTRGGLGYDHSTNNMLFRVDNDTRMTIDASGLVGIGTSTPSSYPVAPDLVVDAGTNGGITIKTGSSNYGGLYFADGTTGNEQYRGSIQYSHDYAGVTDSMQFGTAGTEAMRIDSSGNLLVGVQSTTLTGGSLTLPNSGIIAFHDAGGNARNVLQFVSGNIKHGAAGSGVTTQSFYTSNSLAATIDSSGLVGIGTSTPSTFNTSNAAGKLVVGSGSGNEGITVYSGTTSNGALCFADGTSSTDTYKGYIQYNHNTNSMQFATGHTERMRIDDSGNVGIGAVPEAWTLFDVLQIGDGGSIASVNVSSKTTRLGSNLYYDGAWKRMATGTATSYVQYNGDHIWNSTASGTADVGFTETERMRIDSSGNLLVGTTDSSPYTTIEGFVVALNNGTKTAACFGADNVASRTVINIVNPNGQVGSITTNASATAYNTSSDQRLKENIADAPSASNDIDAIQVRSFDWKADGSHQKYGMVAQELQSVAPEAVSAPEDPDEMMGVDYSKLVPMLVKEIQSLRARVAQLES